MDPRFKTIVDALHPCFEKLMAMQPVCCLSLPAKKDMPKQGIYVFSENGRHLYVGRSNRERLRIRILTHCKQSARRGAAFAFKLAREQTGRLARRDGTRMELYEDLEFMRAFEAAKARIRNMELRFVEQTDPTTQALLEVYAAVVLETRYNDFDTH